MTKTDNCQSDQLHQGKTGLDGRAIVKALGALGEGTRFGKKTTERTELILETHGYKAEIHDNTNAEYPAPKEKP